MSTLLVTPVTTEKAYAQSLNNIYVFNVPLNANRNQVAEAVESQYDVKVKGVKIVVQNGKAVRFSRGKNRYPGTTHRVDTKKAYVSLAEGSSLSFFEQPAETEEEKK